MVRLLSGIAVVLALSIAETTVADNASDNSSNVTTTTAAASADAATTTNNNEKCSHSVCGSDGDWEMHEATSGRQCSSEKCDMSECCSLMRETTSTTKIGETWIEIDKVDNVEMCSYLIIFEKATAVDVYVVHGVSDYAVNVTTAVRTEIPSGSTISLSKAMNLTGCDPDASGAGEILDDDAAVETRLFVSFFVGLSFIFLS